MDHPHGEEPIACQSIVDGSAACECTSDRARTKTLRTTCDRINVTSRVSQTGLHEIVRKLGSRDVFPVQNSSGGALQRPFINCIASNIPGYDAFVRSVMLPGIGHQHCIWGQ